MTYWKATQPDGTDFRTGTVDYAAALTSGVPVTVAPDGGWDEGIAPPTDFPGPGWLHMATVPTECVGMSWPCRLFEVEPVGDVVMDNAHPHKIGARSVRVLCEIEAHRVFGPQGEQVAAFIERCATLTEGDMARLGTAWDATRGAAWRAAREAAWDASWGAAREAAWDAAWDAAWGAAREAAWGLLLRDLIGKRPGWDQDAYALLTGPWRQEIGPIHPDDGDGDE